MSVSCKNCVLSDRVLCDGPIPRPEENYRVLWVSLSVTRGAEEVQEVRVISKETKKERSVYKPQES